MNTLAARIVADFGPHRGRMGRGFGHPGLFILGVLLLAGVITAIVLLARGNRHWGQMAGGAPMPYVPPVPPMSPVAPVSPTASAETILNERLARGEVSIEDFVAARAALRGEPVVTAATPPPPPAG